MTSDEAVESAEAPPAMYPDPDATLAVSRPGGVTAGGDCPSVPGFDVLGLIDRGGMGSVWRARQHNPPRLVALKVPHNPHPDEFTRARFVREIELAASLEHPNIARVYHTDTGGAACCYAMELIEGVSLDEFVARNKLGREAVLRLVMRVGSAVQYAHSRGIIHRDLKPANILVTGDGEPHILDFGVAKSVLARPDHLLETAPGAMMGTLAYMAPEQAAGDQPRISTRSDVYSLGKILYRLLLGAHAHEMTGSEYEVRRRIIEQEARRPRAVDRKFPRELERLLLAALAREAGSRYGSVGELCKDIERYLDGRPLALTESPATAYVLRKWVGRYRVPLATAATLLLVLAVAAALMLRRLGVEENKNEAIAEYVRIVIDLIDPADPGGRELTLKLLEHAERDLERRFADQPAMNAAVRHGIGQSLLKLGQFQLAQEQFTRARVLRESALGPGHPDTLASAELLAESARERGEWALAEQISSEVYERSRQQLPQGDAARVRAATLRAAVLMDLARLEEAEVVCRRALREDGQRRPAHSPEMLDLDGKLALVMRDQAAQDLLGGRAEEATKRIEEAEGICRRRLAHFGTGTAAEAIEATHHLASVLCVRGRPEDLEAAARLYESALARARVNERLKGNHPDVLIWKGNYAHLLLRQGKAAEAVEMFREIAGAGQRLRGPKHRYTLIIRRNYAVALQQLKRWGAAEEQYRALLPLLEDARGPSDPEVLQCREALASTLIAQDRAADAVHEYRIVHDMLVKSSPQPTARKLEAAYNLAYALVCVENLAGAEPLLQSVVESSTALLGAGSRLEADARSLLDALRALRGGGGSKGAPPTRPHGP